MLTNNKIRVVPVAEALSKQAELEINGLTVSFRNDEPTDPELPSIAKPEAIAFEVRGLPHGHRAWIVQENARCQLMQEQHGVESEWLGEYSSVEDALRALSDKMSV